MDVRVINREITVARYSVQQGNHGVDRVTFLIPRFDDITDLSACNFYIKTEAAGQIDKIPTTLKLQGDGLAVIWDIDLDINCIPRKMKYQIVAENLFNEIVWNTNIASLYVTKSIEADEYIIDHYPTLLQQWEKRMQELELKADDTLHGAQGHSEQAREYAARACESVEQAADGARAAQDALQQTQAIQTEVANGIQAAADAQKAAEEAAGQAQTHRAAAEQSAQNTAADRAAVEQAKADVTAAQQAVEGQKQAVDTAVGHFEDAILPAAIQAVEDAGQALVDAAKAHADRADASAEQAGDSLAQTVQAVGSFVSVTLPAAVESVNDAGTAQVQAVQDEGAVQIGRATQQADRAKAEADRAAAINPYSKDESDARYAPIGALDRVHNLERILPTATASGTGSVTLDNCAAAPLRSLIVRGGAKQEAEVEFEQIAQEVIGKHPTTARIEEVDGRRCLVCRVEDLYNAGNPYYQGAFRGGVHYTAAMTAKEVSRYTSDRPIALYLRFKTSAGYTTSSPINTSEWTTVSITTDKQVEGIAWLYGSSGTVAVSIDDFTVTPGVLPTPEHPISPVFVGNGGSLTVSMEEGESLTAALPRPLIGPEDWADLTSGQGEASWTAAELNGSEDWTASENQAPGGTVFRASLPNLSPEPASKPILSSHFRDAGSPEALTSGGVCLDSAVFIAVPNALTGVSPDDTDSQKADKCKAWLAVEKAANHPITVWYPSAAPEAVETTPLAVSCRQGTNRVQASGGEGEPVPPIQATAVQDLNQVIQELKNMIIAGGAQ